MQKIFSQEIRFKADDGSDHPDWEEKKLGDIALKGSSNISANQIEHNNGDFKIFGASGYLKSIDFYTEENSYIAIVKDGAGVGRAMLLESKTAVLGTLGIIKAKLGNDINFLYWLIKSVNFRKYIVGSTIPHIYFRDYQNENVKIPSLPEQEKIANFLSAIDSKIEQIGKQLDETKQFKKALLQQMFV
jgi:type I restriction enzyme, S subunit